MTEEEKKKESGEISRREFLKDAGLIVGGAAIGSTVLLAACGEAGETATVTETATQTQTQTQTVTTTQQVGEVTTTVTETVSKFICPIDGTEFDTLTALQAHFEAAHPAEPVPVELTKLIVNGETHELKVEPNWTLNFVLREQLELWGVKRGCEEGVCGSCTVLMDGVPVSSCMALAIECEGRSIETIESLAPDFVTLHPIQQAFVDNFGLECGYCTPGIILVTKALLDENPSPTEEEVKQALAGNLCKCGCYDQIVSSVLAAAAKM